MKRTLATLFLTALATSALAHGQPFEQTELDRALPQVVIQKDASASSGPTGAANGTSFEQYNPV